MGEFSLTDISIGDEVEYFIEGGWRMVDGQRVEIEHDKGRVVAVYPNKKCRKYDLGINHGNDPHEGLLRLSEVTRVIRKDPTHDR